MHIVILLQGLLATTVLHAVAKDLQMWRRVSMNTSWFSSFVHQESRDLDLFRCAGVCSPRDWCSLWCHDGARGCLLTDLIVTWSGLEEDSPDARACFTRRAREYAGGAGITSSYNALPSRTKENLIDGVYNGRLAQCHYLMEDLQKPWVLFDLGRRVPVQSVLLVAQPNDLAAPNFRYLEVRLGETPPPEGNFSSYTLLGRFEREGEAYQEVTMRSLKPIICQYVSIQSYIPTRLQLCHVEIR